MEELNWASARVVDDSSSGAKHYQDRSCTAGYIPHTVIGMVVPSHQCCVYIKWLFQFEFYFSVPVHLICVTINTLANGSVKPPYVHLSKIFITEHQWQCIFR